MSFIDLHSHFLPAVDDGAPSIEATIEILRLAHRSGTRVMVATPHIFLPPYNNNKDFLTSVFAETHQQLRLRAHEPGLSFLAEMTLLLGSESYLSPEFLDALEHHQVLPLGNTFYLLIEFSAFLSVEMLSSGMERVLGAGFVPILAHVERFPPFCAHPQRLHHFLELGCVAQINGGSLLGFEGRAQRKAALSLLRQGLVQVIASDAHDTRRRAPVLDQVHALLAKTFSGEEIAAWMVENPHRILSNKALPSDNLDDLWQDHLAPTETEE